ncbi:hypothetical protein [Thiohalospira sp.]|uniref:hypothetical protein n=1 Tax=Thiohalospira sp. TaxID=3080549 RepID=UPI0039805542
MATAPTPYTIEAWMEGGQPRLRIRDAECGTVALEVAGGGGALPKPLFRELVLLAARGRLKAPAQPGMKTGPWGPSSRTISRP